MPNTCFLPRFHDNVYPDFVMLFPPVCSSNNDQVAIFLLGGETCRILSDALYTCILVATGEELLKLAGFAEIRSKKFYGAKVLAVIVPVGLWATYHGIQAYNNPVMIVSAFFNGLILMSLLWMTKSFLAPIIAHGLYNTVAILLNCVQGTPGVGTPMFPSGWGTGDIFPIVLAIVWVFFILPIIKRYPSEKS